VSSIDTVDYAELDAPIAEVLLLSIRSRNALMRRNIKTLRLLIMHTPELLLANIPNLGPKSLAEIEAKLAMTDWRLAESADPRQVGLIMGVLYALQRARNLMHLGDVVEAVNCLSSTKYSADEVTHVLKSHPYFVESDNGFYRFQVRAGGPPDIVTFSENTQFEEADPPEELALEQPDITIPESKPAETPAPLAGNSEQLDLSKQWSAWFDRLKPERKNVLMLLYGVQGEAPMTLQEVGQEVGLTRERVRQVKQLGLRDLRVMRSWDHWKRLHGLLYEAVEAASDLLTPGDWQRWLDDRVIWEGDGERPSILALLCDLLGDFHYIEQYDVVAPLTVQSGHLQMLQRTIKYVLNPRYGNGLTADELVQDTQDSAPDVLPRRMLEHDFIVKAASLFEMVRIGDDGCYYLRKNRQQTGRFSTDADWMGKPGTRLHEWETRLRNEFVRIAWIGQTTLTEGDFLDMCRAIQEEAQAPNYFSKVNEGNPRLVPAAVFVTTMVLSARYAELAPDEAADEFWAPYLRTVWRVEYSQAYYARCKQRFNAVVPFLEQQFGFEFPRSGKSQGDVVTPLFRHALIPRYMQHDFATWLGKNWRDILAVSEVPALLATHLQQDRSLDVYYSHRLKKFFTGSATASTAAAIITNMSAAISLHVNDGEPIDRIGELLHDTPIEQELWQEIAQEFTRQTDGTTAPLRVVQPKVTWVWSLEKDELNLRVQNIIVPVTAELAGSPDRVVWLEAADDDPLQAEIEEEVFPWRMTTGERVVDKVLLREPDGPAGGTIALMTDMDEVAARLTVPQLPADKVQFFRLIQQGAYGVPLDPSQITDGTYLVCAATPLEFLDDDDEAIAPDSELSVPYPLGSRYTWAAQVTLALPVKVMQGEKRVAMLEVKETQPNWAPPVLTGDSPVAQLSRQVQPTFADTRVAITFDYGGERLLKQVSMWLKGQDGWRYQRPLADLYRQGHARLVDGGFILKLDEILPNRPNSYTLDLRASLTNILPAPIQFAVVPGLTVEPPSRDQLYTQVNPPHAILHGIERSHIIASSGLQIQLLSDDGVKVTWTDLRHDPAILLRFGNVDIPLVWSVPYFAAWLEPKIAKPFYTIDDLKRVKLNAHCVGGAIDRFAVSLRDREERHITLRLGRYSSPIRQTQLYDMVRLAKGRVLQVDIRVGAASWPLFEVRKRPELGEARVRYQTTERLLHLHTGLAESWPGNVQFWAESLTRPFSSPVLLGRADQLEPRHTFSTDLEDGAYVLRVELDDVKLALPGEASSFVVGHEQEPLEDAEALIREIRGGRVISRDHANGFILMWAESAEKGSVELTPSTLYQLATISGHELRYFGADHLRKLWAPLASLRAVREQTTWIEKRGLLPAWVFLEQPVILKTLDRGHRLPVYPIYVANGGHTGRGLGHWRLSTIEGAPKENVYVVWNLDSALAVQVEAALPAEESVMWAEADLLDMYGLYHCTHCGRLTGARSLPTPQEILGQHKHGDSPISLRDITMPVDAGGHKLLAELYIDRRAPQLVDSYVELEIALPSAAEHLPEPRLVLEDGITAFKSEEALAKLLRDVIRLGESSAVRSPMASASRLLAEWQQNGEASQLGQSVFALGVLLRMAAYNVNAYRGLLKNCALTELDVQQMLNEVSRVAPQHLEWGLTWAELLVVHST
jgi:hypothetical protein